MGSQVIDEDKLGTLTKIGQGGQGVVYTAPRAHTAFAPSMVYKKYKPQTLSALDSAALAEMPQLVEKMPPESRTRLISMAAWPVAVVTCDGVTSGFVMPSIPDEFFVSLQTVKGTTAAPAEFQHLLNEQSYLDARGIQIDDIEKYCLLRELASHLTFLHEHGICVGDLSPKNVLFALEPQPAVYFVDCDAMRVNGVSALAEVETTGWEVPAGEPAGEGVATRYSDTYKLGLMALRLLAGDQDEKDPRRLPEALPNPLRRLIADSISSSPESRPTPVVWTYMLDQEIRQARPDFDEQPPQPAPARKQPSPTPVIRSRPPTQKADPRTKAAPETRKPPASPNPKQLAAQNTRPKPKAPPASRKRSTGAVKKPVAKNPSSSNSGAANWEEDIQSFVAIAAIVVFVVLTIVFVALAVQ